MGLKTTKIFKDIPEAEERQRTFVLDTAQKCFSANIRRCNSVVCFFFIINIIIIIIIIIIIVIIIISVSSCSCRPW